MHRLPLALAVSVLLLTLPPRLVSAHAIVVAAEPAPHSVVPGPDVEIELRFNSRIDARRSRLSIVAGAQTETAVPLRTTDAPDRLLARLQGLAPGDYKLKWQVLAVDGHITRGEIPFQVRSR
jgi:copper resistance protein C